MELKEVKKPKKTIGKPIKEQTKDVVEVSTSKETSKSLQERCAEAAETMQKAYDGFRKKTWVHEFPDAQKAKEKLLQAISSARAAKDYFTHAENAKKRAEKLQK